MSAQEFDQALWQAWRQLEDAVASNMLERCFGYVALQLDSGWMPQDLLPNCPVRRQLRLAPVDERSADACMELDRLAIGSGSVDVVVLPHTLEFAASPQALLREVDRVLAGEGHLLITGFNPWSAWSAARYALRGLPRRARSLSALRLRDWLELLGFEIIAQQGFFRRPPLNAAAMLRALEPMEQMRWLPLPACGYALLARKHLYTLTPVRRPGWERDKVGGLVRPAMRT